MGISTEGSRSIGAVLCCGFCFVALTQAAMSADEIAPLPGLDACVAGALQARPGVLFGWQRAGEDSYKVAVMSPDGKIADATCSASKPGEMQFENRIGMRRFEHYEKIKVPEASARATAPLPFAGTVQIKRMEIDTGLRGNLTYEYQLSLPSGHEATVQVDSMTGMLVHGEMKSASGER